MKKLYFACITVILFFSSCNDEKLYPCLLVFDCENLNDSILVSSFNSNWQTNYDIYDLQVLKSQNFKNVRVIINNSEDRGYWELPCEIPMLQSGDITIDIYPVYQNNGNSQILRSYPFLHKFSKTVYIKEGGVITLGTKDIKFRYINPSEGKFSIALLESFQQSTSFVRRDDTGAEIDITTDAITHNNVGVIRLNNNTKTFDLISQDMIFQSGGGDSKIALLQFEYRMDPIDESLGVKPEICAEVRFTNGLGTSIHNPLVNFICKKEWTTVYVDIGEIIGTAGNSNYTIRDFKVGLTGYLPEELSKLDIYIDNLKIIAF